MFIVNDGKKKLKSILQSTFFKACVSVKEVLQVPIHMNLKQAAKKKVSIRNEAMIPALFEMLAPAVNIARLVLSRK
ncbi:hypothetical protein L1987_10745 [Smallanthus sonchifolius]|uniref:Uncharacterized protein n=1 Tax=Smallanthus sonchifolius TaxID=185202 RepID=A0ACB9J9J3_9ASTR|nr:hypothetical protein L1987_10745 [Smallanthus sonchifolius]